MVLETRYTALNLCHSAASPLTFPTAGVLFLRVSEIALEGEARLGKGERKEMVDAELGRRFSSGDFLWRGRDKCLRSERRCGGLSAGHRAPVSLVLPRDLDCSDFQESKKYGIYYVWKICCALDRVIR